VPENDHGDPGDIPFDRIIRAAQGGTPEEDDSMAWTETLTTTTPDGQKHEATAAAWLMYANIRAERLEADVARVNAKLDKLTSAVAALAERVAK
jgi:hypothetical protein